MVINMLPDLDDVVEAYSMLIDSGEVDEANFFIALLAGYSAFLWRTGLTTADVLSNYFNRLRMEIVDGPDYLNPYLMEIIGILSEGLSELTFKELLHKLRSILKEDRLDIIEV